MRTPIPSKSLLLLDDGFCSAIALPTQNSILTVRLASLNRYKVNSPMHFSIDYITTFCVLVSASWFGVQLSVP